MNLEAFMKIDDLEDILKSTGIDIPRLRGLDLMANKKPYTEEQIQYIIHDMAVREVETLVKSEPAWTYNPWTIGDSAHKDRLCKKYLTFDDEGYATGIIWNNIHGKHKKVAKYKIKKETEKVSKYTTAFNKYAGRKDVLYIHARIGGCNWNFYGGPELAKHPAFLEKVDDYFDTTYCDIYLKVDPKLVEAYLKNHPEED